MLKKGDKAPGFTLNDHTGTAISLDDFSGKKVVIYFYPKDDTPGCTKEACSFRDNYDAILAKGAAVIGISPDGEASHTKFRDKFNLPFHLVSDPDRIAINGFGARGEKSVFGKTHERVLRSTFVISEDGTIIKTWPKVRPVDHALEVLEVL